MLGKDRGRSVLLKLSLKFEMFWAVFIHLIPGMLVKLAIHAQTHIHIPTKQRQKGVHIKFHSLFNYKSNFRSFVLIDWIMLVKIHTVYNLIINLMYPHSHTHTHVRNWFAENSSLKSCWFILKNTSLNYFVTQKWQNQSQFFGKKTSLSTITTTAWIKTEHFIKEQHSSLF